MTSSPQGLGTASLVITFCGGASDYFGAGSDYCGNNICFHQCQILEHVGGVLIGGMSGSITVFRYPYVNDFCGSVLNEHQFSQPSESVSSHPHTSVT